MRLPLIFPPDLATEQKSFGAINSASIAGNPHADRVDRLRRFWKKVSAPADFGVNAFWSGLLMGDPMRDWFNRYDDAKVTLSHPTVLALPSIEQSPAIYDFPTRRHDAADPHPAERITP